MAHPWLGCKGYGSGGPSWEHICCTQSNGVFVVALVLYIFYICWQLQEWGHPETNKDMQKSLYKIFSIFFLCMGMDVINSRAYMLHYKIQWTQNYIYINETLCVWTCATMVNKPNHTASNFRVKYTGTIFLWNVSNHLPDNIIAQLRGHKVNPHSHKNLI